MNFRGILKGKLLVSIKLLPVQYSVFTWAAAGAGLLRDLVRLRWYKVKDRVAVMSQLILDTPNLLRERHALFSAAKITPEAQLNRFLQLTDREYT